MPAPLVLTVDAETFAIARLGADDAVPGWATNSTVYSITKLGDELSIVCPDGAVPADVRSERGWRCLSVIGPLDFGLTGILASLAAPLAEAEISIFAVSTYDTDALLVKQEQLSVAIETLERAGHSVRAS